jgi:VWFA-related protein
VRTLIVVTLGLLLSAAGPAAQRRDESPYTLSIDVDLVLFNVTVRDRRGLFVPGLEADNFEVLEDGRVQAIGTFAFEDRPASVGLVIDNSGSMGRKRADVVQAAVEFVGAGNSDDEMFVVTFNEEAGLALPGEAAFTNDPEVVRSALIGTPPGGMTALYDALALGLEHLKAGRWGRKALVVLSDGGDNASRLGLDEVLRSALASSATIYTIGIYDDQSDDRDPGALRKIAEQSGGRAYFPDSMGDLGGIWQDISDGIRSQYTIGYRSTNPLRDGAFRRVRINAKRPGTGGLRVDARQGYFAPVAEDTVQ